MHPKISIICPVYNVEKFLHKCIESIINQTFQDWELILVDDGSKDASGNICDEYANEDNRIQVIHKTNCGVGSARQMGLDTVQGEYVIHVDSDDWVESTMLEELYVKAKETNADVVICDFFIDKNSSQERRIQKPKAFDSNSILIGYFDELYGSCCNKLVRTDILKKYNIKFFDGINYCEDLLSWIQLYVHDNVKTSYLNKAFYHYVMNEGSITHNLTRNGYEGLLKYYSKLSEILSFKIYPYIHWKVKFGIFMEAFHGENVLTRDEIIKYSAWFMNQKYFSSLNIKWKIGFWFLKMNCNIIAKKLLSY